MPYWSGSKTCYVKLRDTLMVEMLLHGGANRGELLRKITLSVSVFFKKKTCLKS